MKTTNCVGFVLSLSGFMAAKRAGAAAPPEIVLANFSNPSGPFINMKTLDDPVMGGKSKSECYSEKGFGLIWKGTVEEVDFLKAPGFCTVQNSEDHDFSALKDTKEISFYVDKSESVYFHPMGVQINNRLKTALRIPITYWTELEEEQISDNVVRLFAAWEDFTAMIYGQPVPAPPLDPEELSSIHKIGMTTYFGHKEGLFSIKILAITGTLADD